LPIVDVPAEYVVFKALERSESTKRRTCYRCLLSQTLISFLPWSSWLITEEEVFENVIIPYAAGCQTIGILPYREAENENPRAVIGLTDITATKKC